MFYNSNNWNLIAQIVFELQKIENIEHKLLNFKSLEENIRAETLLDISWRLQACGFPENSKPNIYEHLIIMVPKDELPFHLMEAIHYIDQRLCHNNQASLFMLDNEISVSPMRQLNINAEELGIMILPRLYCAWSRNTKGNELSVSNGINELMQNYYYINIKSLESYTLQNYVIKSFNENYQPNVLRIAVSPLTNGDVLVTERYTTKGKRKIGISGVGSNHFNRKRKIENQFYVSEKELVDKTAKIIEVSTKIQADILMFPEMLGTSSIRDFSLEVLANLSFEKNKSIPFLTLLPTEWEYNSQNTSDKQEPWKSGNNTNTLYAACRGDLLNGSAFKETFRQQKQTPYFEKETSLSGEMEDIKPDRQICLLHVPSLGRIAFPICADFISDTYRKILIEILGATLILCPSFSKGFDDFIQRTNMGKTYGCRIIWCNSCAVRHLYENNKHFAFKEHDICCTGGSDSRSYYPIKPNVKCQNGQCGNICLFYIDIPLTPGNHNSGKLSWQHLIY